MKSIHYISTVLFAVLAITACKKESPLIYEAKSEIYFQQAEKAVTRLPKDSTAISFALVTYNDTVTKVVIAATGAKSEVDRTYKLTVDPLSTAKEGSDYDQLPSTFTIKKNMLTDTLAIKFHRTAAMLPAANATEPFYLTLFLNLESNENFENTLKDDAVNGLSKTKYRFFVNDQIIRPIGWVDICFGVFSRKKLLLMSDVLGITPAYLNQKGLALGETLAYGRFMQRYLADQILAGNTIKEEDGRTMSMGTLAGGTGK
ncbi:DUF4843 domain-containing protein [Pedobacter sp. MW01-1-1]|uniref:DUF4843 domain-containing protein n=1 Tax=Pedobacter sp. MW01-1-1 TaxID=3383027 RepID=UPI003FED7D79